MSVAVCVVCGTVAALLRSKNGYPVHRCRSCGQLFVWPPPDAPLDIYSEKYFAGGQDGFGYVDYDRDKQPMVASFERYLDLISRHSPGYGKLLDVGAATGFFLALAMKHGWKVQGVEPCEYAAGLARQKGLDVRTGVFEDASASYDVITALDVLEHIPDPRAFVRTVNRSLAPNGLFAINTPDGGSAIAKWLGVHWHAVLPPEHLQLFNRRSLALLLHQEGFEILEQAWIGKQFTLQYIFQTLSRVQKISLWSRVAGVLQRSGAGQIAIPMNLHDNLFVLARKRSVA